MAIPDAFADIDLKTHTLLLDVDGTLLDIAPTPDRVAVPGDLRLTLARLSEVTGGAIALVSGRQIAALDRLFTPLQLSAVGVHGAELRVGGNMIDRGLKPLPQALRDRLARGAAAIGLLTEDKGYSFALHFRNAPEKESAAQELAQTGREQFPDENLDVTANKMLFEVVRRGVSKGRGIEALMTYQPFAGRRPVFVGDDRTDEDGFVAVQGLQGLAFAVARDFPGLAGKFSTPDEVRRALTALARH
jgi:trehalose 6-phosphate phosphatase